MTNYEEGYNGHDKDPIKTYPNSREKLVSEAVIMIVGGWLRRKVVDKANEGEIAPELEKFNRLNNVCQGFLEQVRDEGKTIGQTIAWLKAQAYTSDDKTIQSTLTFLASVLDEIFPS